MELTLNGRNFSVHHFTGRVVSEKKWTETEVTGSGGGGGGYSYKGTGFSSSAPVNISSKTTGYDQFILQDEHGREKSFKFADLDLACREGNTLSVVWIIRKGDSEGPYWWVYNHNSGEKFPTSEYKRTFEPPFWGKALAIVSAIAVAYGLSLVGMGWYMFIALPLGFAFLYRRFYYGPQGNTRANEFWETKSFESILRMLRAGVEKPAPGAIESSTRSA